MSLDEEIKKLCSLSKLEIEDALMEETSKKIKEVLLLFDKLDEYTMTPFDTNAYHQENKIEKDLADLRDDIPRSNSNSSEENTYTIKFLNTRNGFIIGPRI